MSVCSTHRGVGSLVVTFVLCAMCAPTSTSARASDSVVTTVVVDLAPAAGVRPWLASAFEQNLARELSGFERLTPVAKEDFRTRDCGREIECRLRVYRDARVDIVLFGRVDEDAIAYELYQTWTPARLATGSIAIGRDQTRIGLKQATRAAFHPVLKHGGLLDQRPYMATARDGMPPQWTTFAPTLVAGALLVALLPFAWLAIAGRELRRVLALRSARHMARIAIAVVVVALLAAAHGSFAELVAAWPWLFAGLGGAAWGAIALLGVRGVFPPLDGIARVAHHEIWRILRIWLALCALRLALLCALYAPVIAVALWLADWLAMPQPWTFMLLVPATGFFARAWLAAWIDCIAARLDDRLVDGPASPDHPRSREIVEYLTGYVRRTGWDVDPALLASVVFLPGDLEGIATYGGGATHARIVIDKRLLALAMGEPAEAKPDDPPAVFPDWTAGTVEPRPSGPLRGDAPVVEYHARKPPTAAYRKPIGQAATLLGHVIPSPGELVPLISDNPQDLAVVRSLLSEHYPWDAPDPDDEFDPTDPTDKDFLFGALVRELGVVQRRDAQLQTFKLLLGARFARLAAPTATRIADTHTVLNFAHHHLVQYLYLQWSKSPDLLTARASSHRLHDTSLAMVATTRDSKTATGYRALRRRLIWLSQFTRDPIVDPREVRNRRLVAVGLVVAALAGLGVAIRRAVDYHHVYLERIDDQETELWKRERDRKQQEGSAHGEVQEK